MQVLVVISIILFSFYLVILVSSPLRAVLYCMLIKPIIDMTYGFMYAGLNLSKIISVLFVFNLLLVLFVEWEPLKKIKGRYLVYLWIILTFFSYGLTGYSNIMKGLELLFRYLNFLLPYLILPLIIQKDKNLFFRVLFFASCIPIFITLMQVFGIHIGNYENTISGLLRPRGFFHDIFTNRLYFLYGLVGSSYSFFKSNYKFEKLASIFWFILSNICMVSMYSKSGYLIVLVFVVFFAFQFKGIYRYAFIGFLFFLLIIGLIYFHETVYLVYQKEIKFFMGKEYVGRLFQGRVFGWIDAINAWRRSGLLKQFFGQGQLAMGMHNDFLRILYTNGIFGLFFYIVFIAIVLFNLFKNMLRGFSFEVLLALCLVLVFLIDSIGLVPTMYPAYNWMVWGIVSYAISERIDNKINNNSHILFESKKYV